MTTDLYNTSDVQKIRIELTKEQNNKCLVTGLDIPVKQHVLDHAHDDTQLVRGVLHRQVNAFLGKAENAYTRLIKWWYPNDLPTLMRECADYLEREQDTRYRHTGWIRKVNTEFRKLKESEKDQVLLLMNSVKGKNGKERNLLFQQAILTRDFDYVTILQYIRSVRNEN